MNLIKIRKDLHQIPELGFKEFKTQAYIMNILKQFLLTLHTFDFTGIVAEYKKNDGDYLIFRADMDALPITEETGCGFESIHKGRMHACGHDIHMTILLGLIEKVVKIKPDQNILFVFQPAEEGEGGAAKIIETGIFNNYKISAAFALHVYGKLPIGTISTKSGIFFANASEFNIRFEGKTAHVAFPENGKNSFVASIDFYQEMKKKLSQRFGDKYICEIGKISAGQVRNAIPDKTVFEGTMRSFSNENQNEMKNILREIAQEIQAKTDVKIIPEFLSDYVSVDNNDDLYQKFVTKIKDSKYQFLEANAVMTGEDFGFFTKKFPGLLFWLGADNGDHYDLHYSKFLPDEKAIDVGIDVLWKMIE